MDPRMLRYYSQELAYMREMGAEFAGQFPKIAARLALDATEVADPYVERLLEGFSFLAARDPPQAGRRVPALHPAPARDGVPALSRADAGHGHRPVRSRP